jgi:hypothetical protein
MSECAFCSIGMNDAVSNFEITFIVVLRYPLRHVIGCWWQHDPHCYLQYLVGVASRYR